MSVGSLQVCAGHEAGREAVIHAMELIFNDGNMDDILLIDAKNIFNSVNRDTFIHNNKIICPVFVAFVSKYYSSLDQLGHSKLVAYADNFTILLCIQEILV